MKKRKCVHAAAEACPDCRLLEELRAVAAGVQAPERIVKAAEPPPGFVRFKLRGSDCTKMVCPSCGQKGLGIWPWISSYQDRFCRQVDRAMERLWSINPARYAMSRVTVNVDGGEIRDHPSRYSIQYFDCCKAQLFERHVEMNGKLVDETWYSPAPHPGLVSKEKNHAERNRKADEIMASMSAIQIQRLLRRSSNRGFPDRLDAMREVKRRGFSILTELGWPAPDAKPEAVYMNRYTTDRILAKNIIIENPYDCADEPHEHVEELHSILEHWLPEGVWTDAECFPEYNPKGTLLGWVRK